jgi:nucleoside phosphorylase
MTRTAIIAAMPGELKFLVRGWRHERRNGVDLWRWSFDQGEWIAACAGAGIDAATRAFAEIEKLGPVDQVISTGWAGALRAELAPGQAYRVSGVIDARTGERFPTTDVLSHPSRKDNDAARVGHPEDFAEWSGALKGHGFSRAAEAQKTDAALAAEGMLPQGLKPLVSSGKFTARLKSCPDTSCCSERLPSQPSMPRAIRLPSDGTTEVAPFQNQRQTPIHRNLWLVTGATVADQAEKQRLSSTTPAALVDMEAAAIARLAAARAIPFFCVKGISDGYTDQLPDFNCFISKDGRFQLARFVVFALRHPSYWPALTRMGENSKKAARAIAVNLHDLLAAHGLDQKAE